MKSTTIRFFFNQSSVLNRVYLLIVLLIVSVLLITAILTNHLQAQQELYDRISRFHTPTIYHTDKLASTLQDIKYIISQNQEPINKDKVTDLISNYTYSIKNRTQITQTIAALYPSLITDNAQIRLQHAADELSQLLHDPLITNSEKLDQLPFLIESTLFRTKQLNRLHININDKQHQLLENREKSNTTSLIQLTAIIFILASVLIIPLLLSIHRIVKSLKDTEQHQRKLRETAEIERSRMWALLSAMNIGVLFEDNEGHIEFVNPAFNKIWAIDINESLTGLRLNQLLEYSPHHFISQEHASKLVFHTTDTLEISERLEIEFNHGLILTQRSFPVLDSEQIFLGRLWIYEDITHERQSAQQLLYLAEHDPLTGLNNRHQFQKQLSFMINTSQRTNHKFALLYFDLDDFKYINDTFGHNAGDNVLQSIAGKTGVLIRGTETLARLGGDEFALIAALDPDDDISNLPIRIISAITSIPFGSMTPIYA